MIQTVKYIHFIINPIAGKGTNSISEKLLATYFSKEYFLIKVNYTKYPKHAITLTKLAMENKPDCIVACGGDGTINEIASCLVGSPISLGIVPIGSGNGLASNLKIPKSIPLALSKIKLGKTVKIDIGRLNEHYFFSNTGFGIDALVIKKYQEKGSRTLVAYLIATCKAMYEFKYTFFKVSIANQETTEQPFMFFISNSNEMGYGISLTPNAILNDGKLNVVVVPKINLFQKLFFGLSMILKRLEKVSFVKNLEVKELVFSHSNQELILQIDGEFFVTKEKTITITVLPETLNVIT